MKSMIFGIAALFACAAFAAQNDALVSFSTPGPDTYADGTVVLDGECYALVWSPKNAVFELLADGTATGGEIVLTAPVAKGGRCPSIVFQVPADKVDGYKNGEWSVYLLDTRRIGTDGVAKPAGVKADGSAKLVNAAGEVAGSKVALSSGTVSRFAGSDASCASVATGVPEGVPRPEIAAIRVAGGNVYVTVQNTVPFLQYDLTAGDTPDAVTESVNNPRTGDDAGEVILVAPAKGEGQFFKVGRSK